MIELSEYIFEKKNKDTKKELKTYLPTVIAFLNSIKNAEEETNKEFYTDNKEDIDNLEKLVNKYAEFNKKGEVIKVHPGDEKFDKIKSKIEKAQKDIKDLLDDKIKKAQEKIDKNKEEFANIINKEEDRKKRVEDLLTTWQEQLEKLKEKLGEESSAYSLEESSFKNVQGNLAAAVTNKDFKDEDFNDLLKRAEIIKDKNVEQIKELIKQADTAEKTIEKTEKENDNNSDNETPKETTQTEKKVVESKYVKELTSKIKNIEPEALQKTFIEFATDDIKKDPDGTEYLGLTILTLGTILLKDNFKNDTSKIIKHIDNILKKEND